MARRGAVEATIKVSGLTELQRDVRKAEKETQKQTRDGLKKAAEPVLAEWRRTLAPVHERSASKLRIRVRTGGVLVAQSLRKTTGEHPEFATLQIKQGEAALERRVDEAERILEREINDLADTAEGKI